MKGVYGLGGACVCTMIAAAALESSLLCPTCDLATLSLRRPPHIGWKSLRMLQFWGELPSCKVCIKG